MSTKKLQLLENIFPSDPQAGQVLSIDANGNKVWTLPYVSDGTLTDGYTVSMGQQLFVVDITKPNLGIYAFPSLGTYLRISDNGVKIAQTYIGTPSEIEVRTANSNGVVLFAKYASGTITKYEYSVENNSWTLKEMLYSASEVDTLLSSKFDSPTNTGATGQVPIYQEDGSTAWGEMPEQVQADWNETDTTSDAYIANKPSIATDDEVIDVLIEADMLYTVSDSDGALLADENSNILLW